MTDTQKKRICWTCILLFISAMLLSWFMTSCYDRKFDEIKEIPDIVYAGDGKRDIIDRYKIARHFGYNRGYNSVTIDIPSDVDIWMLDNRFRSVDYYWFRVFNKWYKEMLFENGIQSLGGAGEALDCDNFSMMYKSMMSVAAYKSGGTHEPAVVLVKVHQVNEFGGIPGTGGLHLLVMVMTNRGWFIMEPQTGQFVKLEEYPNQQHVSLLIF